MKLKFSIGLIALLSPFFLFASQKYSESKFNELLNANTNILVHVHASWCPTCKVQKKNLARIKENDFVNVEVDFDKDKAFLKKYKVIQQSTFLAFAKGLEVGRKMGISKEEDLRKFIQNSFQDKEDSLQSVLDKKRSESKLPDPIAKTMKDATAKLEK